MDKSELNRREFQRLAGAAFGGMLLGAGVLKSSVFAAEEKNPLISAKDHVCRGLNTCKAKGADGKNTCAGTGSCALAKKHTCHASNDCKGQGGCGAHPGGTYARGTARRRGDTDPLPSATGIGRRRRQAGYAVPRAQCR